MKHKRRFTPAKVKRIQHHPRNYLLGAMGVVLILIVIGAFIQPSYRRTRISHMEGRVTAVTSETITQLNPVLKPLDITIDHNFATGCEQFDPALDNFDCTAVPKVTNRSAQQASDGPANAAKLIALDNRLKQAGWQVGPSNDFRLGASETSPRYWLDWLSSSKLDVAYSKKTGPVFCSLEFTLGRVDTPEIPYDRMAHLICSWNVSARTLL